MKKVACNLIVAVMLFGLTIHLALAQTAAQNATDNERRKNDDLLIIGGISLALGILTYVVLVNIEDDDSNALRDDVAFGDGEILPVYDTENDRIGIRYRINF